MKIVVSLLFLFISAAAYSRPALDGDGVPKVDLHGTIIETKDPKALKFAKDYGMPIPSTRMIDVDGKLVSLQQFILAYCQGKISNETCARASKIQRIDNSSGPRKQLPAGL